MSGELLHSAMTFKNAVLLRSGLADRIQTSTIGDGRYSAQFAVSTPVAMNRAQTVAGEEDILVAFLEELEEGMVFWDVGAAEGTWSCFAAPLVSEVRAFDPYHGNAQRLVANAEVNGEVGERISVERVALGDRTDTSPLVVDGVDSGTHHLDAEADVGAGNVRSVSVRRGDSFTPTPDAIKIDVEGAEMRVLDGLGDSLSRVRVVAIEVHPNQGVDPEVVRTRLEDVGLSVREFDIRDANTHLLATREVDYSEPEAYPPPGSTSTS